MGTPPPKLLLEGRRFHASGCQPHILLWWKDFYWGSTQVNTEWNVAALGCLTLIQFMLSPNWLWWISLDVARWIFRFRTSQKSRAGNFELGDGYVRLRCGGKRRSSCNIYKKENATLSMENLCHYCQEKKLLGTNNIHLPRMNHARKGIFSFWKGR